MVRFRPLVTSILLFALFAIAVLNFVFLFSDQNNPAQNILTDPNSSIGKYYADLNNTLASSQSNTTNAYGAFENSSINTDTGIFPFITAIGGIWKVIWLYPKIIYDLTIGLLINQLLAGSPLALTISIILGTIVVITIISAIALFVGRYEGG